MAARGVAKRYAQAIFDLATEMNTREEWLGDLMTLADAASDPVAAEFFTGPNAPDRNKRLAMDDVLPGMDKQLVRNLVNLLIERRRFDALPEILEVYREMLLDARGIAIANVTTAVELTPDEQEQVKRQLSKIIGRQIELRTRVDPSIIGGLVARIGDRLIDGSVVSQLRNMRAALAR